MHKITQAQVAIGGIGGSGTRAVATLFAEAALFMGYDLNHANDNLLYTLLFKHKDLLVLPKAQLEQRLALFYKIMTTDKPLNDEERALLYAVSMQGSLQHSIPWLQKRAQEAIVQQRAPQTKWGWKEPNTHVIIERLIEFQPDLHFLYVYRNGLDMAHSSNQNQLQLWGSIFLSKDSLEINPKNSLKYWCSVHRRMQKLQIAYPKNIYMLNIDTIYINYKEEIEKIMDFCKIDYTFTMKKDIFMPPNSIGRYKNFPLDIFDKEDVEFVMDTCSIA